MAAENLVWGFLARNWLDAIEAEGGDVESALRGVSFTRASLGNLGARVPWDELAECADTLLRSVGPEAMERSGERHAVTLPIFRSAATALQRPSIVYAYIMRGGQIVWPVQSVVTTTSDGLELRIEVPARLRPCQAFFLATTGTLRALPRILGQPDASVVSDLTQRVASYRVTLPAETPAPREPREVAAERFLQSLASLPDATLRGQALNVLLDLFDISNGSLALRIQRAHGLTREVGACAARLSEGAPLLAIANELEVGLETVRTHLRNAFRKTGVRRQAELVALVLRSP